MAKYIIVTNIIKEVNKMYRYKNFPYETATKVFLENVKLANEEILKIRELEQRPDVGNIKYIVKDLFKFYKMGISTKDIAEVYGVSQRMAQIMMKKLNLNKSKSDSAFAVKKQISNIRQAYKNMFEKKLSDENSTEFMVENFIRYEIDIILSEQLPDSEIIVGISSLNSAGLESDIPIIIVYNNYLYKFLIQIDGKTFLDIKRSQKKFRQGYTIFRINIANILNNKYLLDKEVTKQLKDITDVIVNSVVNSNKKVHNKLTTNQE